MKNAVFLTKENDMSIFDDILNLPGKVVEKTFELPGDILNGARNGARKTAKSVSDALDDLFDV